MSNELTSEVKKMASFFIENSSWEAFEEDVAVMLEAEQWSRIDSYGKRKMRRGSTQTMQCPIDIIAITENKVALIGCTTSERPEKIKKDLETLEKHKDKLEDEKLLPSLALYIDEKTKRQLLQKKRSVEIRCYVNNKVIGSYGDDDRVFDIDKILDGISQEMILTLTEKWIEKYEKVASHINLFDYVKERLHKPNTEFNNNFKIKTIGKDVIKLCETFPVEVVLFNDLIDVAKNMKSSHSDSLQKNASGYTYEMLRLPNTVSEVRMHGNDEDLGELLERYNNLRDTTVDAEKKCSLYTNFIDHICEITSKDAVSKEAELLINKVEDLYNWLEMQGEDERDTSPNLRCQRNDIVERPKIKTNLGHKPQSNITVEHCGGTLASSIFIIPGAATFARVDALGSILEKYKMPKKIPWIVLAGRCPRSLKIKDDETPSIFDVLCTEAQVAKGRLFHCYNNSLPKSAANKKIIEEKIIVEENSQDTFDNINLGLSAVLRDLERKGEFDELSNIFVITSPYHIRRIVYTLKCHLQNSPWRYADLEKKVKAIPCNTKYDKHNWYIEEKSAGCFPKSGLTQILNEFIKLWSGRLIGDC